MSKDTDFSPKNPSQRRLCSKLAIEQCLARRVLCVCNVILTHPLFADIEREETHKLSAISDLVKLEKGRRLFLKGAPIEHVYFVLEGKLKLSSVDQDSDKVFVNQIVGIGDGIALESLFSDLRYFHDSAEALEPSTVLLLHRHKFRKIVGDNPVIMQNLLGFISERVIDLTDRLRDQVLTEVHERLLKFLEAQSITCDESDELGISKTDLAYILGTVPATLSRAIKKLEEDNLIAVSKYSISLR